MQVITDWTAQRSGGRITIYGTDAATGKTVRITHVDTIKQRRNATSEPSFAIVAMDKDGMSYRLVA